MDYLALKAADAALGIADPGQAATALNAQPAVALPPQDIPATAAQNAMLRTLDWPNVVLRARMTPTSGSNPPTTADQAIKAAVAAVELAMARTVIGTSDSAVWALFFGSLQLLQAVGDLSQASVDAISALRTPTAPAWDKLVIADDVVAARAMQGTT